MIPMSLAAVAQVLLVQLEGEGRIPQDDLRDLVQAQSLGGHHGPQARRQGGQGRQVTDAVKPLDQLVDEAVAAL